jgi:hypothetical protein
MPFDAPVTTATLPDSFAISSYPCQRCRTLGVYGIDVEVSDSDFFVAVRRERAVPRRDLRDTEF